MSAARLIAMMAPVVTDAIYVGAYSHGEFSNVVDFHADAQAGDFAAVMALGSPAGGSGAAWTVLSVAGASWNVSYRKLQTADLTTPLHTGADTPVVTMVWRGPNSLAVVQSDSKTAGNALSLPGFTKSAACIGLLSVTFGDAGVIPSAKSPPFNVATAQVGPSNYLLGVDAGLASTYIDSTSLSPSLVADGNRSVSILELRF